MSETNNLRALLMAALVVMSVFAGVGTVSAVDSLGTATDVSVSQDTAIQNIPVNTSIANGSTETITVDPNSLPGDADVLAVGATSNNENIEVTDSGYDANAGTGSVTIENTGSSAESGQLVTLKVVYDTSDMDLSNLPANGTVSVANESAPTESAFDANFSFTPNEISNVNFQGEVVHMNVSDLGQGDLTLRSVDERGDDGSISQTSFISQLNRQGPSNNYVEIDTSDLEGDYVVSSGDVNNGTEFEVATQSLRANWSESSVTQGDSEDLELTSGRSNYVVEVSASGLDADDLQNIFGGTDEFVGVNEDDDSVYLQGSTDSEINATFSDDIDADNYNFNVEVTDTTASDSASIEVTESDADVNFEQGVYTQQVGDLVHMSVNMDDREEAYVFVGGEDVNYLEAVHLTDDDEDGVVNFTFNTYTASEGNNVNPFQLEDESDDELELATGDIQAQNGNIGNSLDGTLNERLEPGDYDLRTSTSLEYNVGDDEVVDEQDVATLDLTERNTSSIHTWTAPSGNAGEYDDVQELANNVNQSNTLALGDRLVVQVNASGVSGIVEEGDISSIESNGINLTIEQSDAGANSDDGDSFDLTDSNAAIYQNQTVAEDQFFVVVDTRNTDFFDDDEEYDAVFTVGDEDADTSPIDYVDDEEEESVSTTFTAEEPEADLDLNDDDQYEVAKSQNAQVQFNTNLAGGSEVSVRLRSSESGSAFLLSNTVDTDGNGTVTTTFDTSDIEVGTTFDVIVRSGNEELANEDGIIVEGSNMTGTGTDSTVSETPGTGTDETPMSETPMSETPSEESPTEGSATPTEGTGTSTDGSTPGFGVVVAVTALLAAALLAVRRD